MFATDATATRNKHVHFSARLHEVAANHNAGIGVGVVDQLRGHCLPLFSRVSDFRCRPNNKDNLLFAVIFYLIASTSCVYVMELEQEAQLSPKDRAMRRVS